MPSPARREVDVLFDGSFEGFLCVVYAFYYVQITPRTIQSVNDFQPSITQEEYFVLTDGGQARTVEKALQNKISADASRRVYYAFLSSAMDRLSALLHYIVLGFKLGGKIEEHLHNDCVLRVHKMAREVGREAHKLTGFCRFEETAQGIYYCGITPEHHVLEPLAEHFSDRMMDVSWVIHDKRHHRAAVYNTQNYTIVDVKPGQPPPAMAGNEQQIQNLWTLYFNTLAIEARKNPKLHRQMVPIKFRGDMTEFRI